MIISKKLIAILPLALLALTSCDTSDTTSKPARSVAVQRVEVIKTSLQPVSHQKTITGTLEAATIVHLHNEVSGRITALPFHEGDYVSQGTAVIKINDDLIEAELQKAVAYKKQASLDLTRLNKLIPKKLASEEDLTRAATELEIATAEEKLQRTRLSQTVVLAPFNGIVTEPGIDRVIINNAILEMFPGSNDDLGNFLGKCQPFISTRNFRLGLNRF